MRCTVAVFRPPFTHTVWLLAREGASDRPAAGYRAPPRVPASAELRGRRQPPGLGKKAHREPAVLPQQLQHQRLHVVSEPIDLLRRHASLNQLARKSSTRYTRVTLPQGE
jgi:hypothetical protein